MNHFFQRRLDDRTIKIRNKELTKIPLLSFSRLKVNTDFRSLNSCARSKRHHFVKL